jgi:transposase
VPVEGKKRFSLSLRRRAARLALDVAIEPRANGKPICSGCGQRHAGYDRLPARRFAFMPIWGIAVFFVYAPRRVDCPRCGVKVERVP